MTHVKTLSKLVKRMKEGRKKYQTKNVKRLMTSDRAYRKKGEKNG